MDKKNGCNEIHIPLHPLMNINKFITFLSYSARKLARSSLMKFMM